MPSGLLVPLVVLGFVLFCLGVLFTGDFNLLALGIAVPALIMSVGRPDWWVLAIMLTSGTTLRIPGLPGELQLFEVLMIGFVLLTALRQLTTRRTTEGSWSRRWSVLFLAVLLVTMRVRGSGFKVLGSDLWGGARYAHIICGLLFFLISPQIRLSERQWKFAVVGAILSGILPAMAEIVYVFSRGRIWWQYVVLLPRGTTGEALEQAESGGLARFTMLSYLALIYLLPFVLLPFRGRRRLVYFGCVTTSFFLGGLTGHRMALVVPVLYVWTYGLVSVRNKMAYLLGSAVAFSVTFFVAGQLAFLLPKPFQRMLSVVPLARISPDVAADAQGTIIWRYLLWREALKILPNYLWVGKGFAYSIDLAFARDVMLLPDYVLWWALVQTAYHQGVLSLLIGLGIPGLVTGIAVLAAMCARHRVFLSTPWHSTGLQRLHRGYYVLLVTQALSYVFIYGDVFVSFPRLFLYAAILEGLVASNRAAVGAKAAAVAEPVHSPGPFSLLPRST